MKRGPLQPHSGAIVMVLYHYLKNPQFTFFDVRMKESSEKVYRAELAGRTRNELVFRVGKAWPCYSRVYLVNGSALNSEPGKPATISGEFRIDHNHSSVMEEFRIEGKKLFSGKLRSEKGIPVNFEGEFVDDKNMWLIEEYPSESGGTTFFRRDYEIERSW
jgi:hypothetical protein